MEKPMPKSIILFALTVFATFILECGKDKSSGPSVPDPVSSFTTSGGTVTPATISFQNTSQNADSYVWRFGDGDSTTITNPTHVYDIYDNYAVVLIAKSSTTGRFSSSTQHISITPGIVYVDAIIINDIPFTDAYGAGWDLATGPDPYTKFVTNTQTVYTSSIYYLDVSPSDLPLQYSVNPSYQITDWTIPYFVQVFDYDDVGDDDYMGVTNGFRINNVIQAQGYTSTVPVQNTSGSIQALITLRWQ
jgi:PKD repeat protein